jgi:SAM-dependent methyltransferase
MNLSYKIRKLFTKEAYQSAFRRVRKLLAATVPNGVKAPGPLSAERFFREIDSPEFQQIRERYGVPDPANLDSPKYISYPLVWLGKNIARVKAVDLDFGPKRTVLDIGSGVGYFLYICQRFGHRAVGLDIDEDPIFREMTRLLKVERRIWRIDPFVPLPDFGCKFDLVTAHFICFNGHKSPSLWGVPQWSFFITDLSRQLNPDAEIYLELNTEEDGTLLSDALRDYFENQLHATITGGGRNVHLLHRKFDL